VTDWWINTQSTNQPLTDYKGIFLPFGLDKRNLLGQKVPYSRGVNDKYYNTLSSQETPKISVGNGSPIRCIPRCALQEPKLEQSTLLSWLTDQMNSKWPETYFIGF